MSGVPINNIVKRSISLSPRVNEWAEELAEKRGFGNNFSGFVADLVRRSQEQDAANIEPRMAESPAGAPPASAPAATVSYGAKKKPRRHSKAKPAAKP